MIPTLGKSLTQIAVLILAIWLAIASQTVVSSTVQLILGIVAAVLILLDGANL